MSSIERDRLYTHLLGRYHARHLLACLAPLIGVIAEPDILGQRRREDDQGDAMQPERFDLQ